MKNEIIYDAVDGVNQKCVYNGGGINALQESVATLKADTETLKNMGVVKSIQRGCVNTTVAIEGEDTKTGIYNIPISTVNPNRCIIVQDLSLARAGNYTNVFITNIEIESNNIKIIITGTVALAGTVGMSGQWQVIEFY